MRKSRSGPNIPESMRRGLKVQFRLNETEVAQLRVVELAGEAPKDTFRRILAEKSGKLAGCKKSTRQGK